MYEIIDDSGVIHSGSEEEMKQAFDDTVNNKTDSEWFIDSWHGDLKLVHIIQIYK